MNTLLTSGYLTNCQMQKDMTWLPYAQGWDQMNETCVVTWGHEVLLGGLSGWSAFRRGGSWSRRIVPGRVWWYSDIYSSYYTDCWRCGGIAIRYARVILGGFVEVEKFDFLSILWFCYYLRLRLGCQSTYWGCVYEATHLYRNTNVYCVDMMTHMT